MRTTYTKPTAVVVETEFVLRNFLQADSCSTSLLPSPLTREPGVHQTAVSTGYCRQCWNLVCPFCCFADFKRSF